MGRPKKLSPENILAGLGIDVHILGINEVMDKRGKKQIHISVENTSHTRKCPECGCTHCNIKDSGSNQWAYHVTQGERIPCKLFFHRERYICKNCNISFTEELKDASETEDAISLLFFTEFPSLEEYCLAYDFNYPRVDMSDPQRRYPS